VATLVCFHAHPDDECIGTGGVMARASSEGHRVVLVTATGGEHGEVAPGVLAPGESLGSRRAVEVAEAARILGVHRHEVLGYVDSGMMGTPENSAAGSFWQAPVEEAAERLAALLVDEAASVLTVYDDHGGYGHPDHIQVHRVGRRAAEIAGTARVYEATIDRDRMIEMLQLAAAGDGPVAADSATAENARQMLEGDGPQMGSPAAIITTRVDVAPWVALKRDAMKAHASQIPPESFFLSMPDEAFTMAFGQEAFIRAGVSAPGDDVDVMAGL
jgi:LmbE family N-acetylglucosaminyl deacetylase